MSKVIGIGSKKPLSEEKIKFLAAVQDGISKPPIDDFVQEALLEDTVPFIEYDGNTNGLKQGLSGKENDIPEDSLMITGRSGDVYAITEDVINSVISGERDITSLEFYDDFLATILYEWLYSIGEE